MCNQHNQQDEREHPTVADLAYAALSGVSVGLADKDRDHLLNKRCEHCEQWLLETWSRSNPPAHVLARLRAGQYPEASAYGAALREHINGCKRCQERLGEWREETQ